MATEPPVRLIDVAKAAGVSVTTVSHALSGKGRIPEATRQRVLEQATAMRYRPNLAARRLAGGRSQLLAIAVSLPGELPIPVTEVNYFNRAIHAATACALEHNYAVVVCPPTPRGEIWARIPLDGLIVLDPVAGDPMLLEVRARGVPLVLIGRDPTDGYDDYCVDNDHTAGTRAALDHLAASGATRVALLAGDMGDAFTDDCIAAHRQWCSEHDIDPIAELVPFGQLSDPAHVERVLARPDRPDGVYANEEAIGSAVVAAAERLGLRIPDDLLVVVAADDQPAGASVPLTTLELNPGRTAEEAVELLIELVEGRPPDDRLRLIPTRLVERDSTRRVG
jgi:DNA-binding LacI/PurR family transcriptional regulator